MPVTETLLNQPKKKEESRGRKYSLISGEKGSRTWKAFENHLLSLSLWGDLLLHKDVSFFYSAYFGFLCLSTHGRRWPPKSKNLFEFPILGREDLIGPFGVKWLPLTQLAKSKSQGVNSTDRSSGFYPCGWESGGSFHRRKFVDSADSPQTLWSLTTFPLKVI